MSNERINLQNTPTDAGVKHRAVRFESGGVELAADLYEPADGGAHPAVIVTGAWTTVKEQMAGTYARELAARGFVALAFDFRGWGASQGAPRFVEDPKTKTEDIAAAARFLASHPSVDKNEIYGLGVCASSGYMASAVADEDTLKGLALIAPWLHTPQMAQEIYGGAEAASKLVESAEQAATSSEPQTMVAASATDDTSLMYQAPYYTETDRGLIDAYDNQFNVASWKPWLTYDAQDSADRLSAPTLIVCSEAAALPAGAHAYAKRTKAPVEELWLDDVNQFDFYDRADVVATAANAVAKHFGGAS